jgi:hypothetical protein
MEDVFLIRIIQFIFGKPDPERKFFYWFGVIFYFIAMITFTIQIAILGSFSFLIVLLFPGIVFPLFFRITYYFNTKIYYRFKGKRKQIFIFAMAFIVGCILIVTVLSFFSKDANVVFNSRKTNINGDIHLTVGSLKGSYTIEQFSIGQSEKVSIPYEASTQQGGITLLVKDSSQTIVWVRNILLADKGNIEFIAEAENYVIEVSTTEAKKIEIKLLIN